MQRIFILLFVLLLGFPDNGISQEIDLFAQFNGRYNYTAIGNTLNENENNIVRDFCEILPSSEATLSLSSNQSVIAAYLYWAGSGLGDTTVKLNDSTITATNTYTVDFVESTTTTLTYFSSYADITNQIKAEGSTLYTFSELDISNALINEPRYCGNRTNFAGWSIYIIYEEDTLPLNQVNLFQGLEIINRFVQEKTITLNNINVLDNNDAKIGFLAWEGDNALNINETLSINGNILSNPPLNLPTNAFNGTNSFTGASNYYNCDLDFYSIENNINIGDTQVEIKLTTAADLIILNNIITVLNSQLPDATPTINSVSNVCESRLITIDYSVYNINSTDPLPANTPIAFYINGVLIVQSQTQTILPINGSENGSIDVQLPNTISEDNFILTMVVDDDGAGNSTVIEITETNNTDTKNVNLIPLPIIRGLESIFACDIGFNSSEFDLTTALQQIEIQDYSSVQYYSTIEDLRNDVNEILIPEAFEIQNTPSSIFIKTNSSTCFDIFEVPVNTENCPPTVPQGFSPNNDGFNDFFKIQGLYTIFDKHELFIYNRYGELIFIGNDKLKWYGLSNKGITNQGELIPVGVYFYILELNDKNYKPLTGWVYVNY